MNFLTIWSGIRICALILVVFCLTSAGGFSQTNYVLVQTTPDKLLVPYNLQEAIPFTDSTFLKGPACTLVPEFEAACDLFNAIDINRAFLLADETDTVRYNQAGKSINTKFMHRWYKVQIPEEISSIEFAQYLIDSVGIWAEPKIHAEPLIVEPVDTLYHCCWSPYPQKQYWGINGDGPGWVYRMELPKAWAIHTGSTNERIAIFDWGIEETHNDLDDRDIRDQVAGGGYHGTGVASQVFAEINADGLGMAGINWQAKGAEYRADLTSSHNETADTMISAFQHGCDFINCSFMLIDDQQEPEYSAVVHEAVAAVRQAGGFVIAAGGNSGDEGTPIYPGACGQAIAVAAIHNWGLAADFSSKGYWIDFAAPGMGILAANVNNGYRSGSGTSYATPMVSALTSMIYSCGAEQGYNLDDFDDIYNLLRLSADTLTEAAWNERTGWGLPKLDSAYWFLTKPNTIERFDVAGGWDESQSSQQVRMTGVLDLPYGYYLTIRHTLERWVQYTKDYYAVYGAWVRGSSSIGAGTEEPIVPAYEGKVVEWTQDSCRISTCWYALYNILGQHVGDWPATTPGISLNVAVVGEEMLAAPDLHLITGDPTKVRLSWTDPNEIEQGQQLYRKVNDGPWSYEEIPTGTLSREYPDTMASTYYRYKVKPYTVNQGTAFSDTKTVKYPPLQPENCEATVEYVDPTHLSKEALGKTTVDDIKGPVPSNLVHFQWDESANQPVGTVDNWIIEQRDIHCGWVPVPPNDRIWVCDTVWEVVHEAPAEETSASLCLERGTSYIMRIRTVDIYGDTNAYCNDCNTLQFTTGSYWGCSIHIPVCDKPAVPENFSLAQNWPNPFNASTVISFGLPWDSHVRLGIYDIMGREVRRLIDDQLPAGYHQATWNGRDNDGGEVASGVYFYRIITDDVGETRKMILIK